MDELQRMGNPHDFDLDPPEWACCANCANCVTNDVIGYVDDKAARLWMDASIGICNDPLADHPVIVGLDTDAGHMPCNGEAWEG